MFEARHHPERGWYIADGVTGHLAHTERGGCTVTAFFDDEADALRAIASSTVFAVEQGWGTGIDVSELRRSDATTGR